jgi:hypothetical protein
MTGSFLSRGKRMVALVVSLERISIVTVWCSYVWSR